MPLSSVLRLSALTAVSAITLAACAVAPPMSDAEQEITTNLSNSRFQPATREMRDNIETQELFAQAAFWSREYELNPGDLESAIKLSAAVRKLGNANRAVEIAQTTRALYPRDPYLTAEYAAALIASERAFDAMAPLDEALRYTPGFARLWSLKGAALDQQENYDLARKHYARALEITPNDPNIMANVGLSFALAGDVQTAEGWLRRAVATPGASQSVRQNLALVLELQGKTDEAEKYMGRSAQANLRKAPPLRQAPPMKGARGSSVPPSYPPQQYTPRNSAPQNTRPQNYQPREQAQPAYRPQASLSTPGARIVSPDQQNFRSASDAARAAAQRSQQKRMTAPVGEHTAEQKSILEQISGRLGPRSSQAAAQAPQSQPVQTQYPQQSQGAYPLQAYEGRFNPGYAPQGAAPQYGQPPAGPALAGAPQRREPARRRR